MDYPILVQLLIVIAVIVGLMMIVVLWRVMRVMNNFEAASEIILRRIKEIDQTIEDTKGRVNSFIEMVRNFVFSFEFMKSIKERIEKGSKNESEKENYE